MDISENCNKSSMTSYAGIIRIRLKGQSLITFSQPAIRAPLYFILRFKFITAAVICQYCTAVVKTLSLYLFKHRLRNIQRLL